MKFVPKGISKAVARQALKLEKDAPTLLFASGLAGVTASTVLACRATLKMHTVIERTQNDLDTARSIDHPNYSEQDRKKDIAIIYTRGVVNTGRLYLPALVVGGAAVGCLTKSHNMLQERNLALTAAYAAVDEAFNRYRERVIDKYGAEQDRDFRYAGEDVEIVDDNGKIKTVRRAGPDPDGSMYAKYFDEWSSRSWSPEPEYNYLFLRNQQNWANDMLQARGHLFLNEVYDMVGLPRTKAGAVVGWVLNSEGGDNYIDFGLFGTDDNIWDYVNGREGAILLDFNVDGVIYDKMER